MPLACLHLIALAPGKGANAFIAELRRAQVDVLITAQVVRWIIRPEHISADALLKPTWDLLIIVPSTDIKLITYLTPEWVAKHWSMTAGIPSRVVDGFEHKNQRILHPQQGDVPELTGSLRSPRKAPSTQGLELNDELLEWSKGFKLGQNGAVSMLNLLAFKPGEDAHKSYQRYGKAFGESIGARRGGNAKLVGKIVPGQGTQDEDAGGWEEFALAHYPSIRHFVDMIASEDYQEVNHRDRLPSLRDTCILCTTELHPDVLTGKARL